MAAQQAVREVHVDDKVRRYLTEIVHRTRDHDDVALGASPRASIALFRTSQALAAVSGRAFVQPDDVKRVAGPVLVHRVDPAARKPAAKGHRRLGGRRDRQRSPRSRAFRRSRSWS